MAQTFIFDPSEEIYVQLFFQWGEVWYCVLREELHLNELGGGSGSTTTTTAKTTTTSSKTSTATSCSATSVSVTFDELVTTTYGETIKM